MKWIIMIMMLAIVSGCVTAKYGEVSYARFGDLETEGVYIATDPNGAMHIEIEKTRSNATEDIIEILKMVYEAGQAAGGTNVIP